MRFGILPAYGAAPVETGAYASGFGRLAEELGFESAWAVEHVVMPDRYRHVYPYDRSGRMPIEEAAIPDPLPWLTWVAASTTSLKLGTSILILPQRNPVVLAKTVASLDRLCGGRFLLGIGVGWMKEEALACGTDFHDRGRRTDEYIDAMRVLWQERVATFKGDHVAFASVKCNPRPTHGAALPIHVGGQSAAAARRAARRGVGFIPMGETLDQIGKLRRIMEEEARDAGRDPAEIEITCTGPADAEYARALADTGATRLIVASLEPDLDATRRRMGAFSENVIAKLG